MIEMESNTRSVPSVSSGISQQRCRTSKAPVMHHGTADQERQEVQCTDSLLHFWLGAKLHFAALYLYLYLYLCNGNKVESNLI